jgi:DNA polymerase III subunit delta
MNGSSLKSINIPSFPKIGDRPLFVVHGDSEILKSRAVGAIVEARLPEDEREFGLIELQGRDVEVEDITASFVSGSLFASTRVILLRDLDNMPKKQQQGLVAPLETLADGITVIVTASPPRERRGRASGPNLSAPLVKLAKASGVVIDCNTPSYVAWRDELTPWVQGEVGRHDKRFATGALQLLLETVGANCDRLANEIEKLAIYVDRNAEITVDDVRQAATVTQEQDIFGLTDAIGKRDAAAALEALPILLPAHAGRGAGIPVLAMIARHLRLLWQANYLLAQNVNMLSGSNCPDAIKARLPKEHNIFDAVRGMKPIAQKYAEQARLFSNAQLARAVVEVFRADVALKGQSDQEMDDRMLLETLVIRLCRL